MNVLKIIDQSKKTPLKLKSKSESSKNSASRMDTKSDSNLEILTDKIENFREILLKLEQSVSDTNVM